MSPTILLILYCVLIFAASWGGGWLPIFMSLAHTPMQVVMSFVGGLMLGVALLHLLPHSQVQTHSADMSALAALVGLLVMFFLIRVFHFHEHPHGNAASHSHDHSGCEHPHEHHDSSHPPHARKTRSGWSWLGLALGLSLHTLIDGLALAASVAADADDDHGMGLLGIGPFLAILLHKPLDALSLTTVMEAGGWSKKSMHLVNGAFALMCPLGAFGFYFGAAALAEANPHLLGWALGFSAGVFLCISLGDILPELQFHAHDRVKLSIALLLGAALAYGIGFLEPHHVHGDLHDVHHH